MQMQTAHCNPRGEPRNGGEVGVSPSCPLFGNCSESVLKGTSAPTGTVNCSRSLYI